MIRLSAFADEISPDPVEQLDVLGRHGIRHVEFRSIHGTNVLDLCDAQHEEFRDLLRDRGFGLSAIGSPIGKIKITDPFEPHLARFDTAMDLAEFYDAPRIRIFSYYIPAGDDPAIHRDEVLRRMAEMARIAADRGITLFLENEKGIYGDTAARVARHPRIGRLARPGPRLRPGQLPRGRPADRRGLGAAPVPDEPLPRQGLRRRRPSKNVPAGQGAGQIPRIIAEAVAHGFDGFCTLEPHLVVAEAIYGFTGPERFGDAARALKDALDRKGIAYA